MLHLGKRRIQESAVYRHNTGKINTPLGKLVKLTYSHTLDAADPVVPLPA
jgi:hypothetical protein